MSSSNYGKVWYEGKTYRYDQHGHKAVYYRCKVKDCKGRLIDKSGQFRISKEHTCGEQLPNERAKEAALDRLQELTLSADGCRKAIDIVRQVLKEVPSEILVLMPNETSLIRRVRRIASRNNIKLLKASPEDFNEDPNSSTVPEPSTSSSNEVVKTGIVRTSHAGEISDNEKSTDLIFLKEHENSHCIAMLEGYQFTWKQKINREKFLYACREAKKGCSVSVIIDSLNSKYELRGTHAHESRTIEKRKQRPEWKILKRVDEDGNEIGAASLDDFLSGTTDWEDDDNYNREQQQNLIQPSIPATGFTVSTANISVNDEAEDYHDDGNDCDFQMDDDNGEPDPVQEAALFTAIKRPKMSSRVIDTSSTPLLKKLQTSKSYQKALKSGERCFVCGDELIVSETLSSSSLETFRKACCYLNVKSKTEWFPRSTNFYSFCESCTEEITRIHSLYRKVEEIQSLIFRKVESVEKRIVDAEVVDNWMAEAPQTTAVRFEGFRKQVTINYRNKLKLRREIRFGNKSGQPLIETQPGLSAHMFASDPADTFIYSGNKSNDSINKNVTGTAIPAKTAPPRRTRGRPKSKKPPEEREDEPTEPVLVPDAEPPMFFDSPDHNDGDGFHTDFDDSQDAMSVTSEKEVKFWENDPSKLNVAREKKIRKSKKSDNDEDYDVGGGIDNDSDPDYNEDDDDEDWGAGKKKAKSTSSGTDPGTIKRGRGRPRKDSKLSIESFVPEKKIPKLKPSKETKQSKPKQKSSKIPSDVNKGRGRPRKESMNEFPDCVLTKDGRVFMQGIEIIKNAPGTYKPRPLQPSFSCGVCGKVICSFWSVRMHICGHHLGMYKCPVCQRECTDPRSVRSHIASVHDEAEREECPICGKSIKMGKYRKSMLYHRWMHLSAEERKDPQYKSWQPQNHKEKHVPTNPRQSFMCGQCARTFANPASLKRHEHIYHGDPSSLMCQYCGRILSNRKTLSRHVNDCANKANGTVTNRRYPCPKCPTLFTFRTARSKHLRKIHGVSTASADLPFSCPKCPRKFSNRGGFRSHKKVCVDGEKGFSYKCRSARDPQPSSSSTTSDANRYSEFKVDPTDHFSSSILGRNQSYDSATTTTTSTALGFNYNFLGNYSGGHS